MKKKTTKKKKKKKKNKQKNKNKKKKKHQRTATASKHKDTALEQSIVRTNGGFKSILVVLVISTWSGYALFANSLAIFL